MNELIIYRCEICGNLICMINSSGVVPHCCETEMTRVQVKNNDIGAEKHVPVVSTDGNTAHVIVGEVPHPMIEKHYISHIYLLTNKGGYIRFLNPEDAPEATFILCEGEEIINAYVWCNLHGLWSI